MYKFDQVILELNCRIILMQSDFLRKRNIVRYGA